MNNGYPDPDQAGAAEQGCGLRAGRDRHQQERIHLPRRVQADCIKVA